MKRQTSRILLALAIVLGSAAGLARAAEVDPSSQAWRNPATPPAERARLVVSAMTDDEKFKLIEGDAALDGNGVGVNPCIGHISAIPRLGLPALCMGDGPAGVGNGLTGVTQFPAPIVGAATWNTALMRRFGEALGAEHAAKGHNVVLAPTINILRTPKWGRAAETFGEDPYLTSRMGVAVIEGIQSQPVVATPKHFVANNQEWLRLGDAPNYQAIDAQIPERALREIYYPAFRAAVEEAKAGSVMCAYNRVNLRYACENPETLGVLRREWGFDGYVVTDWYFAHRSTEDAVKAGLDMSMPGGASPFGFPDYYAQPLRRALAEKRISMAQIDAMATNVLTPMFRLGLVDHPVSGRVDAIARTAGHVALAREIAEQGAVLLRNAGPVLPLDQGVRSIAVIGDDAGARVQTTERYGGFVADPAIAVSTPIDAITVRAGSGVKVVYAPGGLGNGALSPVPAAVLRPAEGQGAGLSATYYASPDWSGAPFATRVEPGVDQAAAIVPGLPPVWSARWRGVIMPPRTGLYRFSLTGGGEIRLTIDGRRVAYTPKQNFRLVTQGVIQLQAGKAATIELDYSTASTISPAELRLGWQVPDPHLIQQAVATAKAADVAVVFVSDQVSEGADRTDLGLPGDQDALIEAVAAANPRTVVVLHTVGPVLMPWRDRVSAIFASWYPGEQAGTAIAALLFGDINPSAKLPMTFPADEVQGPADRPERYPGVGDRVRYDEGVLVGYRWYDAKAVQPLFPFGFGLSYTRFAFRNLRVEAGEAGAWRIKATVANVGARRGAEVAQLYVAFPPSAGEPPLQLKGFERLDLAPGEAREVTFQLSPRDLQAWDERERQWITQPGDYTVRLGASSRDLPLNARLAVAR